MSINRILKMACATVLTLMFSAAFSWAQENQAPPPPEHHGRGRMISPEDRTEHLSKTLNLTDDQKSKVLSIYQDEQKQMEALRSDNSTSRGDRWSKMKQIHQNTVSQIKGTLNEDQAKKFDEMQQRMQERRAARRNHDNGNAPPQQ